MTEPQDTGPPGTPITAEYAAVWGAFLYEGLMLDLRQPERSRRILELWNQGCIELITEVCSFLPELWRQAEPYWNDPACSFPGVFAYEVVSELGTMLGDHLIIHDGELPSTEHVSKMVHVLLKDFFTRIPPPSDGHIHPR